MKDMRIYINPSSYRSNSHEEVQNVLKQYIDPETLRFRKSNDDESMKSVQKRVEKALMNDNKGNKRKRVNIQKIFKNLSKKHDMNGVMITGWNEDPFGLYLAFKAPDTVNPKEIERYRNVVRVLDVTPTDEVSIFKAYPTKENFTSFDDMSDKYGLELREAGTERPWFLGKKRSYFVLKGTKNVHPELITATYDGIYKTERLDQKLVDNATRTPRKVY